MSKLKPPGRRRAVDGRPFKTLSHEQLLKGHDARYRSALKLMQRGGDPAKAHALLQAAADDGDGYSIYAIATWRLHGFFLKKNLREATRLLRKAAGKQVAFACFDLAICYELGEGVKQDLSKAAKYFLRAFLLGDGNAAGAVERLFYWYGKAIDLRTVSREFGAYSQEG